MFQCLQRFPTLAKSVSARWPISPHSLTCHSPSELTAAPLLSGASWLLLKHPLLGPEVLSLDCFPQDTHLACPSTSLQSLLNQVFLVRSAATSLLNTVGTYYTRPSTRSALFFSQTLGTFQYSIKFTQLACLWVLSSK